ncbi:hypothetical protein ABZX12_04475 [Kribbella sp. NPDC003505]|uniref:hypothetical protein n=1 Tax=Kribbella sp. NPDC003505 TaxID=3154448 RepID=UPI0033AB26A2
MLTALLHAPHLSGLARLCRGLLPGMGLGLTRLPVATVWSARFTLSGLLHRTLRTVLRPRRRSRMLRPRLLPTWLLSLLWLLYAPHRRTRLRTVLLTARRLRTRRLRTHRLRTRRLGRRVLPARLGPRMLAAGLAARLVGCQGLVAWLLSAWL